MSKAERRQQPPAMETEASRRVSQKRRLAAINEWLAARGLELLADTGTYQRGETEFISVKGGSENPYYATPQFRTVQPDGTVGDWYPKVPRTGGNKRATCVVPVVMHQGQTYIAFLRQDRPVLRSEAWYGQGRPAWVAELPRIFAVTGSVTPIAARAVSAAALEAQAPLAVLGREMPVLLDAARAQVTAVSLLASEPEDTGMSFTVVDYWLVEFAAALSFDPSQNLGPSTARIRFYTYDDVRTSSKRQERDIYGNHTLVGLKLYAEWLEARE